MGNLPLRLCMHAALSCLLDAIVIAVQQDDSFGCIRLVVRIVVRSLNVGWPVALPLAWQVLYAVEGILCIQRTYPTKFMITKFVSYTAYETVS